MSAYPKAPDDCGHTRFNAHVDFARILCLDCGKAFGWYSQETESAKLDRVLRELAIVRALLEKTTAP